MYNGPIDCEHVPLRDVYHFHIMFQVEGLSRYVRPRDDVKVGAFIFSCQDDEAWVTLPILLPLY